MKWGLALCLFFILQSILMAQSPGDLRIMTYNIKFDDVRDTINNWSKRKEMVTGLIRFHDPDVFGIQEGLWHQLEDIKGSLPEYDYLGAARDDGDRQGEYSAIFYKTRVFEVGRSGTFWLSPTPEKPSKAWDAALPRICTWAEFSIRDNKRSFVLFNTHFDHVGSVARSESMKLLLRKIDKAPAGKLVLLSGDFNFTPGTTPYQIATKSLSDSRSISQTLPYGPEATFNGFRFHEKPAGRIDYIFIRGNAKVVRYSTLSDSSNLAYPSDHFPVMIDIKINDRAK